MTGRTLDPASADRLAKILGMLGSAHDGERAAAGAKAHELIRSFGLTWHEVIAVPTTSVRRPQIHSWRPTQTDWQRMAAFCHARRDRLSQRDRDFIRSMLNWCDPSEKQKDWLTGIYARLCREAAA